LILKNAKIYRDGLIQKGSMLINNGSIQSIIFSTQEKDLEKLRKLNDSNEEIDCEYRLILPGIIDIHAHLRDIDQSEKETFITGTQSAAFSGITTVFNMPNTKPPAISAERIINWMEKAKNRIFIDVGFIAGVPEQINEKEIKKIIKLGVFGFKIYPLGSLNGIDWTKSSNVQKLLNISSKYKISIFIHPDWPLEIERQEEILEENVLKVHNEIYPPDMEGKYVNFILENYYTFISENKVNESQYPIIHFCHISCRESYALIKKAINNHPKLKITFETTPHHLLLSNDIKLSNENYGKVLPPLRNKEHSEFLFKELSEGRISLIGTDHAPHTIEEKSKEYFAAPAGFPGFETYPLLILNKITQLQLSLENFVKASSENPARLFNLKTKGFIKENYDADLFIVEKVAEYSINPTTFKTKAKFSPFEGLNTSVKIWKVFLRGKEITLESTEPKGKIIKKQE